MKQKTAKILMNLTIIAMWIIIIVSCYKGYILWNRFQEYPQKEFVTNQYNDVKDINFTLSMDSRDSPTTDLEIKLDMIDEVTNYIRFGVILLFVYIVLDYFYKPEKHFFTWIKEQLEKYSSKEEDEDDEGKTEEED